MDETPLPGCAHSADFRSVVWRGQPFSFTRTQAAIVRQLWLAALNDTPEMGDRFMLAEAESDSSDLSSLFFGHPAWGVMIVPGKTRGSYRLSPSSHLSC